jgi:hypothetical protein
LSDSRVVSPHFTAESSTNFAKQDASKTIRPSMSKLQMNTGQSSSFNPYAPVLESAAPAIQTDAEAMRRLYLNHEASVKAFGFLLALGGFFLCLLAIFQLLAISSDGNAADAATSEGTIELIIFAVLGPIQFMAGLALRKLKPWARIVGSIFSGIGLIAFPIGTLVNGYFLYLLLGKKGMMVCSPEYAAVIEATPHIKYKTSRWVIGLLIALVVLVVLGLSVAIVGSVLN